MYLAMDTHLNKQWDVKEIKKGQWGRMSRIIFNDMLTEANPDETAGSCSAAHNCRYYRQWVPIYA